MKPFGFDRRRNVASQHPLHKGHVVASQAAIKTFRQPKPGGDVWRVYPPCPASHRRAHDRASVQHEPCAMCEDRDWIASGETVQSRSGAVSDECPSLHIGPLPVMERSPARSSRSGLSDAATFSRYCKATRRVQNPASPRSIQTILTGAALTGLALAK